MTTYSISNTLTSDVLERYGFKEDPITKEWSYGDFWDNNYICVDIFEMTYEMCINTADNGWEKVFQMFEMLYTKNYFIYAVIDKNQLTFDEND